MPPQALGSGPRERRRWLWLAAAGLLAAAALAWTAARPTESFDDSYITYRYARNIAQGQGFVYNAGERVLGTTAPLYALMLAGVSRAWPDIPRASLLLRGLGDSGEHNLTADAIRRDGFGPNAAFAGLVVEAASGTVGGLIGYLLYHLGYDADRAARNLHVIDLYVSADARRQGAGRPLMAEAARICREAGGA